MAPPLLVPAAHPFPSLLLPFLRCSKSEQINSDPNSALGSLPYTAPEVLSNSMRHGRHADVWSLGVALYKLITGCVGKAMFGGVIPSLRSWVWRSTCSSQVRVGEDRVWGRNPILAFLTSFVLPLLSSLRPPSALSSPYISDVVPVSQAPAGISCLPPTRWCR